MTPKMKAKWIKALRSGKYKQGKHYLSQIKDGQEYNCCLGVYARISRCTVYNYDIKTKKRQISSIEGNACRAPLGYKILPSSTQARLADMNDKWESFERIADWIERNV